LYCHKTGIHYSANNRQWENQLTSKVIFKIKYDLRMFVGTHKNKKKRIEKTIGNKRSRVGTNRR